MINTSYYKIKTNHKIICVVFGILLLYICGLFCIVNGLDVNPVSIGETYIEWNFSESISVLTIDGIYINNFNPNTSFILSNLEPESKHKITVSNSLNETVDNETTTLPETKKSYDILFDLILTYLFTILSIGLMIIAIAFRIPLMSIIAFIISIIGFISAMALGDFWFSLIFIIILISSGLVTTKVY